MNLQDKVHQIRTLEYSWIDFGLVFPVFWIQIHINGGQYNKKYWDKP